MGAVHAVDCGDVDEPVCSPEQMKEHGAQPATCRCICSCAECNACE
jgi:hypothetical protein